MINRQKETILALLKANETDRNYENKYWFSYKDFLETTDDFTAFSCENLDGKQGYIEQSMLINLMSTGIFYNNIICSLSR